MIEKPRRRRSQSTLTNNNKIRSARTLQLTHNNRRIWLSFVLFACLLGTVLPARADNIDGAWSTLENWPLIAIHAAITPDGRVLTYGTRSDGKQTGYFIYDIWDPTAGLTAGHMTLDNMTLTDLFCSSQIILPQSGEILISGGDNWTGTGTTNTGNNNSNIFDYGDNTLARSVNMNRSRWYSSSTALVNGEIYIQGGNGGGDRPEVRQTDSTFRLLGGAATNSYAATFPRNFLAPDGRIFGYDSNAKMYFVDTNGTGSLTSLGQYSSAYVGWTSGAAMFRPGRILQMGGNSTGAVVIDINGPEPIITPTDSLSSRRHWVSATVLADGKVLATGGSESANQLTGVNNHAEIWDPATGLWHVGSEGAVARLYHSSALLLPDARVLVAGGGAPGPYNNTNAEIYSPPYLYESGGGLAPRPQIVNAPDSTNVGDNLTVQVDQLTISRVTLAKTGSVTHSVNMDQRFIELPFTASGNMLYVSLPIRASDTPPGFYMMFVFDAAGVPSEASMLRINIDSTPNVAVDYTPTIGGSGGSSFQLACDADEILVGVHGKSATYIDQIGPQCIQMDQFGHWIGDPIDGPVTGTTTSGTAFSKTCPRDFAMSGFQGRSGQYVNQLDIECRAVTPGGGLTGAGQFLGSDGGSGGSAQSLLRCGTDNPVYALYGRSGGRLDNIGVLCRTGFVTTISVNSDPVVVDPGPQTGVVGNPVDLQINASDGDGDDLTFSAVSLPTGLAIDTNTGRITGAPVSAALFNVTVTVTDGSAFADATFTWDVSPAPPLSVDPMLPPPPIQVNTLVNYTVSSSGGINVVYKWDFGDGTPESAYSGSPSIAHTFADPGIYYVNLTVTDDTAIPHIQTFVQAVHLPHTTNRPGSSSNITYEERSGSNSRIWVINQDNDSVTAFDAVTHAKLAEINVGVAPRAIAIAPDRRIWITNKLSANISIIDPDSLSVVQTLSMPRASQPYGIVFSPVSNDAYVSLEAIGTVLRLHANSGVQLGSVSAVPNSRHIAINGSGSTLYVSRFVTPRQPGEETAIVESQIDGTNTGGEVFVVDTGSLTVIDTIILQHSELPDAENQGRGVPNYIGAVAISPDGTSARVPSKQDNILRGELRDPLLRNLNFQNTVRAISSRIELPANTEDYARRIDYDNSSVSTAALFDRDGVYAFVALETSREVAVVDAYAFVELFRIDVGRAPQGLAMSADGFRLYVNNFMDRTVDVFDLTTLKTLGQWSIPAISTLPSVSSENLDAETLLGKQLFYDAHDTRLARDRYLSCASCHNDGDGDGRVWDITGMGEGLRNTIDLRGHASDQGRKHWTSNFDEVQDFEGQIRDLSDGSGLMADVDFLAGTRSQPLGDPKAGISPDLDALAAYVQSLHDHPLSPYRNSDGTMTAAAELGRLVYQSRNCATCHGGIQFTDSSSDSLHDIGTIKGSSGQRLGQILTGFDTPTLRGVWSSSPYLHDGSASTLIDAVAAHNMVSLDVADMANLAAYLQQIDVNEASAPAPDVASTLVFEQDTGGLLVMEAEHFSQNMASATVASWSVFTDAGASNVEAIRSPMGPITAPPDTSQTEYPVNVVSPGNHYVWIRYRSYNTGSDSVFSEFDDLGEQKLTLNITGGSWEWQRFSGARFLDSGVHVLKLQRRERDAEIDRILITKDPGYPAPVGAGPAESQQTVGGGANTAPLLATVGTQIVAEDNILTIDLSATDSNGDQLSFGHSGLPGFAIFTDNGDGSASIAVLPLAGDAGDYAVNVFVDDNGTPVLGDAISFVISVGSSGALVYEQDTSGLLVVEAEHFSQNFAGSTVGLWELASIAGASGGEAIKSPAGSTTTPPDTSQAEYQANIVAQGNHYLWIRFRSFNTGSDSLFAEVDDLGSRKLTLTPVSGDWEWKRFSGAFNIDPGLHVIKMQRRERDLEVDRILLTTDPGYPAPVDSGPAESPTSEGGDNQSPSLDPVGHQVVAENATLTVNLQASDPDGDNLVLGHSALPPFASFTDNGDGSGQILLTPVDGDAGSYPINVFVDDDGTPSRGDSETFTLNIVPNGSRVFEQDNGGLLVMEAEHFNQNLPGTTVVEWTVIVEGGASNAEAIKASLGPITVPPDTSQTEYQANVTANGSHYIWIRYRSFDSASDSIYGEVDDLGAQKLTLNLVSGDWEWQRFSGPYDLNAGVHAFKLQRRERNIEIDRILVTTDPGYPAPTGVGPPESPSN